MRITWDQHGVMVSSSCRAAVLSCAALTEIYYVELEVNNPTTALKKDARIPELWTGSSDQNRWRWCLERVGFVAWRLVHWWVLAWLVN